MGFIQKAAVTANPARKNGTKLQNSYFVNVTTREYGISGKPLARIYSWNGDGGNYQSYMPIPVEFIDQRGNKYTLQAGEVKQKAYWTDQFDRYSVKSLDPNYVVTFKSTSNGWYDFYVDRITGKREVWNTKWSKR